MKDNLEKAIKESLKDYQEPYNPEAWQAVNSQLGNAVSGSSVAGIMKWGVAALVAGGLVVGGIFLFKKPADQHETSVVVSQQDESQGKTQTEQTKQEENTIHLDEKSNGNQKDVDAIAKHESVGEINAENDKTEQIATTENKTTENQIESNDGVENQEIVATEKEKIKRNNNENDNRLASEKTSSPKNFVVGIIDKNVVCKGESVRVSNPFENKNDVVKFTSEGKEVVLSNGEEVAFHPNDDMTIQFLDENNNVLSTETVRISEINEVSFGYKANLYEKGLPVASMSAYGDYDSYQWMVNNEQLEGKNIDYHFYEKGKHEVTLQVVNGDGCVGITTEKVVVDKKYNLMAVDAFRPNDTDPRNRAFMPYALKERGVKFEMVIIDPQDNQVVFTSSDVEEAWDGTNQRTGKMTPANKSYIWKVNVLEPEKNERPLYVGTVVHD